jgi:hypothetical protein
MGTMKGRDRALHGQSFSVVVKRDSYPGAPRSSTPPADRATYEARSALEFELKRQVSGPDRSSKLSEECTLYEQYTAKTI